MHTTLNAYDIHITVQCTSILHAHPYTSPTNSFLYWSYNSTAAVTRTVVLVKTKPWRKLKTNSNIYNALLALLVRAIVWSVLQAKVIIFNYS